MVNPSLSDDEHRFAELPVSDNDGVTVQLKSPVPGLPTLIAI